MAMKRDAEVKRRPSPLLQDIVTMPWDLDRFYGKNPFLPKETIFSKLKPRPNSYLPSCLFTISRDIFQNIVERMTKKDAFRLSLTCKSFMWHPVVLKAIFREPISIEEIKKWYRHLPDYGMNTQMMMGPPVSWGINSSTGIFVLRLAVPEWMSAQDIHHITTHCPNLDAVDFTEIFKPEPHPVGWYPHQDEDEEDESEDGDEDEEEECINIWPSVFECCPALFKNLRSVHVPYGCWKTVYSRRHRYQQTQAACLPKLLHLAKHLQSLELTCQQEPTLGTSPKTRRKASANLLTEILGNVSRELTTLGLYDSETTINNLFRFVQSLATFPKLRTIKLSIHRDLYIYQKASHALYDFNTIVDPILSDSRKRYEDDTASVLQYLSNIKKIIDEGRLTIVSSDKGENYHAIPHEYYGLSQKELVLGPRNDLWTPVWTWIDRLDWVKFHQDNRSVETTDIERCRALFSELIKACISVSIELKPLKNSSGAYFADHLDEGDFHRRYEDVGNMHNGHLSLLSRTTSIVPTQRTGRQPKQHFIQQPVMTETMWEKPVPYYTMPMRDDEQPFQTVFANLAPDRDGCGGHRSALHPLPSPVCPFPKLMTQQMTQGSKICNRNAKSYVSSDVCRTTDSKTDIPDPVWRLNEIGDLVDDLRLIWNRMFAYVYTERFARKRDTNPDPTEWYGFMHKCEIHLRGRLWREAEYTALLFRRIPVDFPRLTRLALYIPAALYPDHDQTFIDYALPGTGWTVQNYSKHYESVVGELPCQAIDKPCLKLADEICPFIRRIFIRRTPIDDPSAVIVHKDEWNVTKRPLFDLDGEYKSMEQLLTEPLRYNYTSGEV